MWRWLCIVLLLACFCGCAGSAKESEFWEHDTVYKNWDHLKFSWEGYKNPTPESCRKSLEQGWWGISIDCPQMKQVFEALGQED